MYIIKTITRESTMGDEYCTRITGFWKNANLNFNMIPASSPGHDSSLSDKLPVLSRLRMSLSIYSHPLVTLHRICQTT